MIRRFAKLALAVFLLYLFWPYRVFDLKTQNPRTTSLIELRRAEARKRGRKFTPVLSWKPLREISPALVHAIVIAEDDRFYQHHGFDLEQIRIAFERNWLKRRYVYGGSTITQQLARTLYLRPRKSILRKLKEAVLTLYLEALLPKRRILELYLNLAEWGPGIYGVEAASQYYCWKSSSEIAPWEAAALASILPSPRKWSPFSEKPFLAERRSRVMERLEKEGYNTP